MRNLIVLLLLIPFSNYCNAIASSNNLTVSEKPVFVHAVYFWMNEGVTDAEKAEFKSLLKSLRKVKTVRHLYVGKAAGTERPIVDNTYDVALIVQFRNKTDHDAYQADDYHQEVVKRFMGWIREIRVYDMISE